MENKFLVASGNENSKKLTPTRKLSSTKAKAISNVMQMNFIFTCNLLHSLEKNFRNLKFQKIVERS